MAVYILIFIFGAVVGSFLNVVVLRLNTGESIIKSGSRCFSCGKKLRWFELIPALSFIIQRGRCRSCRSKISWQYPIVEMLTGLAFVLTYQHFGFNLAFGFWILIFSLLIAISIYDFRHQIIPNQLVYPFIALSFFSPLFQVSGFRIQVSGLLAGIILFSFFALLWLVSRGRWMGFGDAKLALGIGWLLGMHKGILALALSFWIGAIVSIYLMLFLGKSSKSRIAFGPFLALATFISFLFGNYIIHWFLM